MKCIHLGMGSACTHLLHQGNEAALPCGREVLRTTGTTGALLRGRDVTACLPHAGASSAPARPEKCHRNTNIHPGPEQSFSPPCARPNTLHAEEARSRVQEMPLPQLQHMQVNPDPQHRQHRAQPAEKRHRGLPGSRAIFNLPKTQTLMTQHQTPSQRQQHWLQVSSGSITHPLPPQHKTRWPRQRHHLPAAMLTDPRGRAGGDREPLAPRHRWIQQLGLGQELLCPGHLLLPTQGCCFSNWSERKTLLCTSLHSTCKGTQHLTACRHPSCSPHPQVTLGYLALPKGPPGRRQPLAPDFLLLLSHFPSSSVFLTVFPSQVSLPSSPKPQTFSKGRFRSFGSPVIATELNTNPQFISIHWEKAKLPAAYK